MTDPRIILIIPKNPPFELPNPADKKRRARLETQLSKDLGLGDPTDYVGLYSNDKLDVGKIRVLFDKRGGPGAPTGRVFPPLENPDGLIDYIRRQLRIRRDAPDNGVLTSGPFNLLEENERPSTLTAIIDRQKAPPRAKEVTKATNDYLKDNSPDKKTLMNTTLTKDWLDTELPRHLRTLAEIAAFGEGENEQGKGIIFHEPHHDLSPGMLLINEIFRALVSSVAHLIEEINGTTERNRGLAPDLIPLISFVNELNGVDGKSNAFTNFILPRGEHTRNRQKIEVDPSRVELFLDGTWIYGSAVIVGRWKGGTHSNGSTH